MARSSRISASSRSSWIRARSRRRRGPSRTRRTWAPRRRSSRMRAVTWQGTRKMSVDTVPDPEIVRQGDVILKVTATAICGSDLHLYNHFITGMQRGDNLGHEFMGEVVETGREVTRLKRGDRVVVPF